MLFYPNIRAKITLLSLLILLSACVSESSVVSDKRIGQWHTISTQGALKARHEAGLVGVDNALYLLGGRGIKPVNKLNIASLTWSSLAKPPIEIHHFQPVVFNREIYVIGAMTGGFPREKPLAYVLIYNPEKNQWRQGHLIPEHRRRGGAGASLHKGKIYLSGGITDGHWTGTEPWFDEYDPVSGNWRELPDMPHGRDHFQSAIVDNKLIAAGGRRSSALTKQVFNLLVKQVDIFDFEQQKWLTSQMLPTPRAGNSTISVDGDVWVVGGESHLQTLAHNESEILDLSAMTWRKASSLERGRHGTSVAQTGQILWTVSGSGNRGGRPELLSTEALNLK